MEYSRTTILNSFRRFGYLCIQGIALVNLCFVVLSCSTLRNIEIEVAILPELPISEDIQSIALLNRSMNLKFTNTNSDSIEKLLVKKNMTLDSIFRDSIAADSAVQVAAKALFESRRFDVVVPKERNILRNDTDEICNPLKVDFINSICKDFKVDAVLVLESFMEQVSTNYAIYTDDGTQYGLKEYNATTDIESKSDWRLYRPDEGKLPLRFQLRDSIFWDKSSFTTLRDLYLQMPRTKEALMGGGIASGLKMAGCISPNWVTQTRYYFLTGKPEIDIAETLIKENKWEEATAIWEKYATIESKRIRSKIEYNLALAAEMTGNMDLAIEWGLKSFKTNYTKAAEVYLRNLDASRQAKLKEKKERY